MEKIRILLPTKRFFNAPEETLNINLELDSSLNLLREGDKNIVLDIAELFKKERNESIKYKIYGKLKMIFKNLYYGTTTYDPLLKHLYLVGDGSDGSFIGHLPYNEFAFLRNDVLREVNEPLTGGDLNGYEDNIVLYGTEYTGHTTITPIEAPYHNWNLFLSYIYDQDDTIEISYTNSNNDRIDFTPLDGLLFEVNDITPYIQLKSPMDHNMNAGEYVIISGKTYNINSTGDGTYNSDKKIINILKSEISSGTTFGNHVFGKRCIDIDNKDKTTSKYYVRKHKIITTASSYILDKIGFESSIWEDERKILFQNAFGENDVIVEKNRMETLLYDFKEPFILSGLTNNLGYTPTEVYITTIFRNKNGYFNYPPKVGWGFNFHDNYIDKHFDGNNSNEIGLTSTNTTIDNITFAFGDEATTGTTLIGDFVEYNSFDMKETVLSDSYHKITSNIDLFDHGQNGNINGFSGSTNTNQFGLFYKPFHKVKLRELSPYVEKSNVENIANLPDNAFFDENERQWSWRDLYDHGYIDDNQNGVNHPFINGIHYVKTDINFYLKNEAEFVNKINGLNEFTKIKC